MLFDRARTLAPALALTLLLAASGDAALLPSFARFGALHRDAVTTLDRHVGENAQLIGVKLTYKQNKMDAFVQEAIMADGTRAELVHAHTTLVLDDDFFQAPLTAAVKAFMKSSQTHIARAEIPWEESPAEVPAHTTDGPAQESMAIKDVALITQDDHFTMSARSLVNIAAQGDMSWNPATRKVTIEVGSVKAAGLPVPLALAFGLMGRFLQADFIELEKPYIRMDLNYFLK